MRIKHYFILNTAVRISLATQNVLDQCELL